MNKKNSIKRQFKRNMKYKSRKNKKMIGGANCSQYITDSECRADVECLWKMKQKVCEPKVKEKVSAQNTQSKEQQDLQVELEDPQHQEVETQHQEVETQHQEVETQEQQELKPKQQTQFLHGKRPISSRNLPRIFRSVQPDSPIKQGIISLKAKPNPTLSLGPPRVSATSIKRVAPTRSRLENLDLVSPIVASNVNWPLITDVVNVPGDGHCLFHALRAGLRSLRLFDGTAIELRTFIVTQLRELLQNGENLNVIFSIAAEYGRNQDNLTFGAYFESQHATDPIGDAKSRVRTQLKIIAKAKEEYELAQAIVASAPAIDAPPPNAVSSVIKGKIQRPVLNPLTRTLNLKRAILEKAEKDLIKYEAATLTAKTTPLNQQVKEYLDRMAVSAWGTEIEIWMASILFGVTIDVYTLPRDPATNAPLPNGRSISPSNRGELIPLTPLNRHREPHRPTIRLFNGSGATPKGIHYQVIPASISLNEFQHQEEE